MNKCDRLLTTWKLAVPSDSQQRVRGRYFTVELQRPANPEYPVHFTLKYRTTGNGNWKWANEELSQTDGELFFQPSEIPKHFSDYLKHSSTDLKVKSEASEAPEALLWSVTAPVKAARGNESGWTGTNLGTPKNYTRWFSLVRPWTPWLAPRHGKAPFDCGNGSILSAFQRHDGIVLVILAVSGLCAVLTELKPDGQGNVVAESRNDREETGTLNLLVAAAPNFESANAACVYHARKLVRGYQTINRELQELLDIAEDDIKSQALVDWHDGLTYCTWNSLGQKLSEDKVLHALDDLKKHDIQGSCCRSFLRDRKLNCE